ncbi:MAG: hypothetical protein CME64_11925 [Halobacteriovoraceae bacterium]|nr:hypothetical protein [Halobacteriovoraceae bacterium]|tara:strand:+ start:133637 stop:134263 length:627 start_codon:yes stop_codon:yes gene_type:complete
MKTAIILTFVFSLFNSALGASITVPPFEMEFLLQKDYEVKGQIELACRYEKFVISDSAEYEMFNGPEKKLKFEYVQEGEFNRVKLVNDKKLYFEYDKLFKWNKECRASFEVVFSSSKYALGHGYKPSKAVSFKLWKGMYDYQEGDQLYDLDKLKKYLSNTTYSFSESQINDNYLSIRIFQDGNEADTSPWVESAYINPKTGKPFPPTM